jgi:ribosomal protein S18 acetylase RimI-like enzyme
VIHQARGLSGEQRDAIAELERRVVDHDGGRLKLEWGSLRHRSGEWVEDLLWFEEDQLVGFIGLYQVQAPTAEVAGMVDPEFRRRGIGSALLDTALALCVPRGVTEAQLIVPRQSAGGRALAAAHDATLDRTEYALLLRGEPVDGPSDPALTLRPSRREDVATLLRLFTAGFGSAPADLAERLVEPDTRTVVVERDRQIVGTLRVRRRDDRGDVYGFVVDPPLQGRGIGRDVLRRVCRQLRDEGATLVGLEVEAQNDNAIHLYTSLGFESVTTEDYWAIRPG